MLIRKLVTVCLVLGFWGVAHGAFAQEDVTKQQDKTILDRLDSLGKTIFGGFLPPEKAKPDETPKPTAKPAAKPYYPPKPMVSSELPDEADVAQGIGRRAGSVLSGSGENASSLLGSVTSDDDFMPENTPPAVIRSTSRAAGETPRSDRQLLSNRSLLDDESQTIEHTTPQTKIVRSEQATEEKTQRSVGQIDLPVVRKSFSRPLHERMSVFRQSAFGPTDADGSRTEPEPKPASEIVPETSVVESTAPEPMPVKPNESPIVAQRPKLSVDVEPMPHATSGHNESNRQTPEIVKNPLAVVETDDDERMLIARKGPVLSVETFGPRRIAVGKESTYEVNIINAGDVAAEELDVFVSLPEWAEVVGADVSTGEAQESVTSPTVGILQWKLGHLKAQGRERLMLKIIPRQSRPFDLAVRWEYRPVSSQASIEVQEPKLTLQLEGPREVLYGKKEAYRLRLMNIGNGAAENVAIMLMPIGGGENVPATHKIGMLAAGEEKVLDVELTARQAGNLTIQLDARADGGVHTELAEKVLVRRAELKVNVEGPKMQFVGATASYAVRVANPGTAPARNVNVSITLPAGSKYLAGLEGARLDANESKLYWTIDTVGPEVEQMFMVKCSLGSAGVSRVEAKATADDELTATADTVTRVEAVADLTMNVQDPQGPVAVGDEAAYEVRVRNRGTKEATNVEVFAYFSRGIEPTGAEGAANHLGPGQVTFQPIPVLAPGAEVVLKVRALAEEAGNHVFRVEAHYKPLGFRLVSEATNLYYTETSIARQTMRNSDTQDSKSETMRTGSRYQQGQLSPVPPRK